MNPEQSEQTDQVVNIDFSALIKINADIRRELQDLIPIIASLQEDIDNKTKTIQEADKALSALVINTFTSWARLNDMSYYHFMVDTPNLLCQHLHDLIDEKKLQCPSSPCNMNYKYLKNDGISDLQHLVNMCFDVEGRMKETAAKIISSAKQTLKRKVCR